MYGVLLDLVLPYIEAGWKTACDRHCIMNPASHTVGNFHDLNFRGLESSDNFVGLYFRGVPTLIT